MDFLNNFPPTQEGKTIFNQDVSVFGLSLQGSSHKKKEPAVPCQDYSDFRFMEKEGLLLAAIADGVGSCQLSHWGSYLAVTAVLDSVEKSIAGKKFQGRITFDDSMNTVMKDVMLTGFQEAQEAVENWADENGVMVYQLQSTLTLAIFDGKTVYHGHVGDDGIVVLLQDGTVHMLTSRLKGEEASSVYPLQSGEKMWRFGKSSKPVAGFFLATDGVLDAFVANRPDYFGINYNNGILYPFINDAVEMMKVGDSCSPEKALQHYKHYMSGNVYQTLVEDDLTLVAVVSNKLIKSTKIPEFSVALWQTIQEESNSYRKQALSRKARPSIGLADFLEALPKPVGQCTVVFNVNGGTAVSSITAPAGTVIDLSAYSSEKEGYLFVGWHSDEACDKPISVLTLSEDCVVYAGWIQMSNSPNIQLSKIAIAVAGAVLAGAILGIIVGRYIFPVISKDEYHTKEQEFAALIEERDDAVDKRDNLQEENQKLQELYEDEVQKNSELNDQFVSVQEQLDTIKENYDLTNEDITQLVEERRAAKIAEG